MLASKDQIKADRLRMNNPYAHLDEEGGLSALLPESRLGSGHNPYASLNNGDNSDEVWPVLDMSAQPDAVVSKPAAEAIHPLQRGHQNPYALIQQDEQPPVLIFPDMPADQQGHIALQQVAKAARQLAHSTYIERDSLWPEGVPDEPVQLLNPEKAFYLLGYAYHEVDTLGEIEPGVDVAGIIDKDKKEVFISRRYPVAVRNFTAAHELGHAIMHQQSGLHRDKPIDGSAGGQRDSIEKEADYFAACFLMPEKLVRAIFAQRFPDEVLNHEVLRDLLNRKSDKKTEKQLKTTRGLARALAGLDSINGHAVPSLAEYFKVSVEAMAIRLEQLGLVPEY
ncbi:ImmA/IrrE family metallo-endopeptidase [Rheinheimera sp.]|uniref:ImmA/IrrE family metallo-endopeptidase n=1 Tax=Rheinheimera sp. TaxID=1869214 RepID=UPI00307D630A